jgi:hypothetical protein
MFMINHLCLSSPLRRGLGTTNLIAHGRVAAGARRRWVKNGHSGALALGWSAAAFAAAAPGFGWIMSHEHFWILKAALDEPARDRPLGQPAVAGY